MTCEQLITAYLVTLREGFHCRILPNGSLCILTPYLYPDHDNIEVFVNLHDNDVTISDRGETLRYLDTVGIDIYGTPNYLYAARRIADGFSVAIDRGALFKNGAIDTLGSLVFDLVFACQSVASLVYTGRTYEPATFEDEVVDFLERHGIEPERRFQVMGTSGSKYTIAMRAPTPTGPALIETVSPKTSAGIGSRIDHCFRIWSDIDGEMPKGKKISLLNDGSLKFKEEDLTVLSRVSLVQRWTQNSSLLAALTSTQSVPPAEPFK